MAEPNVKKNPETLVLVKKQSKARAVYTAVTAHTGSAARLRLAVALVAIILPVLIINVINGAAIGLSNEAEPHYAYSASLPHEQLSAPEEPRQPSPTESAAYSPDSSSPDSSSLDSLSSYLPSSDSPSAPPAVPQSSSPSSPSPSPMFSQTTPVARPTAQPSDETSAEPTDATGDPAAGSDDAETAKKKTQDIQFSGAPEEPYVQLYTQPNVQSDFPQPDKVAYLTIDDGPSRAVTPGILDILKQEGIKATFFVLPHSGVEDIYQRIIDEGHEIGNHSYSHVYSELYKPNDIEVFHEDILLAQAFMLDNYGYTTTTFRFPGGAMSRSSSIIAPRRELLAEMGYRDFDWSVDSGDTRPKSSDKSAEALTSNVLENTRGRDQLIVLMHDTKSKITTLEALPFIITGLREQGYSFDILRNY